jgi:DNA uptake protein ComE-like DNA-binding protein
MDVFTPEKRSEVISRTRIIQGRLYQTLADLKKVEGLGPKTLEKLTPLFQIP